MEGPRTPYTPPKKPSKTMGVIKKAARILAVGSALTGTNPTKLSKVETPQITPNEIVSTEFALLRGDDPHRVMRPSFNNFRRSTNVEDERDAIHPKEALYMKEGEGASTLQQIEPSQQTRTIDKNGKIVYGPYDKDIEDSAERIKADIEAENAAKDASLLETMKDSMKKIEAEAAKEKAETAKHSKVIVGAPKL